MTLCWIWLFDSLDLWWRCEQWGSVPMILLLNTLMRWLMLAEGAYVPMTLCCWLLIDASRRGSVPMPLCCGLIEVEVCAGGRPVYPPLIGWLNLETHEVFCKLWSMARDIDQKLNSCRKKTTTELLQIWKLNQNVCVSPAFELGLREGKWSRWKASEAEWAENHVEYGCAGDWTSDTW